MPSTSTVSSTDSALYHQTDFEQDDHLKSDNLALIISFATNRGLFQ